MVLAFGGVSRAFFLCENVVRTFVKDLGGGHRVELSEKFMESLIKVDFVRSVFFLVIPTPKIPLFLFISYYNSGHDQRPLVSSKDARRNGTTVWNFKLNVLCPFSHHVHNKGKEQGKFSQWSSPHHTVLESKKIPFQEVRRLRIILYTCIR